MKILVDSRQMKLCDSNTIQHFGMPSLVLMERAALGTAEVIEKEIPAGKSVLVVCGTGNNGGDGLAVGRILSQKGYWMTLVMPGDWEKASAETRQQMEICRAYGMELHKEIPEENFEVVVDALFGIGLSRELKGTYAEVVRQMNSINGYKVAVDIPSGIHADTGAVMGIAFHADITVTFAFSKLGLRLYPGAEYAGRIIVKDIGIDRKSFLEETITTFETEQSDLAMLPKRQAYSNKGTFGKVLVVAGHKNMAGAAFFSGKGAYATGAGLVKILTEEENREIIQQLLPEAILDTYVPGDTGQDSKKSLKDRLKCGMEWADVIVAGPGMGTGETAELLVEEILKTAKVPVILDADGLNLLSEHLEWLREAEMPLIITPHLGEMARLTKKSIFDIQKQLLQVAREFAKEYNVICILKDARTITALPDGTVFVNTSGNNGMATAGAGDVLTGVLAGLTAQGMEAGQAAPMGVYLHGAGGDKAVEQTGTYGMMAQDIIEGVRQLLKQTEQKGNKNENIQQSLCRNQSGCNSSQYGTDERTA